MVKISKEQIDKIFEESTKQSDVLIKLYNIAFPDFDDLKSVGGFPQVSRETDNYIFIKFISFDKKYHPNVISGGLWMDSGFGCNYPPKKDWVIDLSKCKPIYKNKNEQAKERI